MANGSGTTPAPVLGENRIAAPGGGDEIIVIGVGSDAQAELVRTGFVELEKHASVLLEGTLLRYRIPKGRSRRSALKELRSISPDAVVAPNDRYELRTDCGEACQPLRMLDWSSDIGRCFAHADLGMIDTGLDLSGEGLRYADVIPRRFLDSKVTPAATSHGTIVASILVGRQSGLLPRASLFAAEVFFMTAQGPRTDAFRLVAALDWLAAVPVAVANLSLGGPDNPLLARAIDAAHEAGMVVVAATGGRAGGRRLDFPARYPDVVAVVGVDASLKPLSASGWDGAALFAAPGSLGGFDAAGTLPTPEAGLSFAAPYATAAFAAAIGGGRSREEAATLLTSTARDLGARGRDRVFGWGLLQASALPRCGRD